MKFAFHLFRLVCTKAIYPWLASYRTQAAQHSPDSLRLRSSDLVIRSAGGRYDVGLYTDLVRLSYTVIRAFLNLFS